MHVIRASVFLLIFIEAFPSLGGPAGRSARRDLPSLDGLVGYLVSSLELIPSARVRDIRVVVGNSSAVLVPTRTMRIWCPWKLVPFGEIVANPSDLKHVVELLRCSDGLGVVITVRLHHLCMF